MTAAKLKQSVLLPFGLACVFLFVLSLVGIYREEEEHIEMDVVHSVNVIKDGYDTLLGNSAEKLIAVADFIGRDERIKDALRRGDRQALSAVIQPIFERLSASYSITHLYVHDSKRVNILRAHRPDRHGDVIDRFTVREAEQSGKVAWGAELGLLGTFTLRAVAPLRDGDRLLGYLELGEDIEKGMLQLAPVFGVELFLLISKQYLVREDWEAGMRMMGRHADWDLLPELVVPFRTLSDYPVEQLAGLALPQPGSAVRVMEMPDKASSYYGAIVPLPDAGGRVVGGILVLRDMTPRVHGTRATLLALSGIAIVVGLSLFGLFYLILDRAERQLESRQRRIMEESQARLDLQEAHVRELERLALYDPLTGLPNRKYFEDKLGRLILDIQDTDQRFVMFLVDVDRMREINDTLGHEIGDLVLKEVAARLLEGMPGANIIACFGGNEFAVLFPAPPPELRGKPIEKLKALFKTSFKVDGIAVAVAVTVGVVRLPEHGRDASTLIRRADVAMRQAKRLKKGCEVYDSSYDPYSLRRLSLIDELRKAIEGDDLVLHYQPQVDVKSGCLVAVEALCRWHHPQYGFINPTEFVTLAERTGLIRSLTLWVLGEVIRQRESWLREGLDIKISVNISAHNLVDSSLLTEMSKALQQRQLAPERLVLEVTESVFMLDPEGSLAILNKMKAMGVELSIDDFGTGYSSLAYLRRMPVQELKIDRSFVCDMMESKSDATIVSSTIALAHSLGLKVVAEGVEDRMVWDSLSELGCDVIQGYFVSLPLPADELVAWAKAVPVFDPRG